jgi:hypothetical protein
MAILYILQTAIWFVLQFVKLFSNLLDFLAVYLHNTWVLLKSANGANGANEALTALTALMKR